MPSRSKTRCLLCRISTMSPLPSQLSWTRPNLRTGYTPFSFFACCVSGGVTARTVQALTASEKKMIFNIKRRGEAYRQKDEALTQWCRHSLHLISGCGHQIPMSWLSMAILTSNLSSTGAVAEEAIDLG